ncbi:MAG: NAD(P)-binding domain-containing protein [Ignavibacteriaceae bacterium]|jgi:thioredoxin reductase/ferredoxin|nr:NAD(P)-binding domain-containing protein [Ignavibacteriaceae bacterium]MCW8812841.1 NAD(P)-binding domain-containing protein [Chlorobium sp.]MCW8816907.1 NAD(P)-binding domain-containing protein [Ignavibacteriaceae bacterium]MCW8960003.1 NAD(P)-binding domain-containing protein [Ignavibacteriaceae bacterium]
MSILRKYFNWLQKDVPTGEVERYPKISENGETSVKGIFVTGDLTGIPLLKLAAENGRKVVRRVINTDDFKKLKSSKLQKDIYDLIIIGAGPAGISAGLEAQKQNLNFKILESSQKYNTIINFPKGKPIYAEPVDYKQQAELVINEGTKESLLEELYSQIKDKNLPLEEGVMVETINKVGDHFELVTKKQKYKALRVILGIGKSGNSRMLKVPGENLPKVFNRLFDPVDAKGHDVLIVGGGDTALETAIAVAEHAKSTTISYRKPTFSRPKEGNIEKLNKLVRDDKLKLMMKSDIKEIKEDKVILIGKDKNEIIIDNSMIFTMIGKELPLDFFKRSKIQMEGELSLTAKLQLALLLLVSCVIYFGKSSADFYGSFFGKLDSWGTIFSKLFTAEFWFKFFALPSIILSTLFLDSTRIWNVTKYINAGVAYIALTAAVLLGIYLLYKFLRDYIPQIKPDWQTFKYFYFISVAVFFTVIFFGGRYFGFELLGKSQSFWYTGLYSLTIFIFGLRRMKMKPTRYIKYQTWTLILIQALPLFILPEFVFPFLGSIGALGGKDGFMLTQVFPGESYWRSYGFILAWPLNFSNLYNGNITSFWLFFSFIQTFVVIPYIVYRWGKGAYCGWICSCGALAETLGDEYRTLAPHGPKAKKWENFGQWALLIAFIITALKLLSILYNINIPLINKNVSYTTDFFQKFYYIGVDVIFAGVLGLGVYFFLSGRVWCRFGCPLAAWMHIVNRFSHYRIFSDKKKCISCNICTKVCHMGIDVMNYANKGIPMNDVECVRCSACVVNCPTEVLTFGTLPKIDTENVLYKNISFPVLNKKDWKSGL